MIFSRFYNLILSPFRRMSTAASDWTVVKEQFLESPLHEKRKNYKCGAKYVTIDQIPSWAEEKQSDGSSGKSSTYDVNPELNKKVSMFVGDITALEIDAIVNAANPALAGGGGVDGAIHSAAGRDLLQAECRTLNGCPTGHAKITGGYNLPAKYVIHTVGSVGPLPEKLKSCYQSSLDVLEENGLRTISFPCISTGVYGYPNDGAANVALSATREWLETGSNSSLVDRIIFCLFLDIDIKLYKELIPLYFPRK